MITKVDATTAKNIFQTGFTLLEMLLVLFLIGLMASTTLMITEGVEDQAKYDDTKRRMEIMRKAIVGDPTRTVNGGPEISGFVADMGRLPECIKELLQAEDCGTTTLTAWSIDASTGIGFGWRGPYIQVLPERSGLLAFRDGYGNSFDASTADNQDFGWTYDVSSAIGQISLSSDGFNKLVSTDDINSAGIVKIDWSADISSGATVSFNKALNTNIKPLPPISFCTDPTKTTKALCTPTPPNSWYGGCDKAGYFNKTSCETALGSWRICSDNSSLNKASCTVVNENWYGEGYGCSVQNHTTETDCVAASKTWRSCTDDGTFTDKATCESNDETWFGDDIYSIPLSNYLSQDICMKIFYREDETIQTIESSAITIEENGSYRTFSFSTFTDSTGTTVTEIPAGMNKVGIYEHDGTDCSDTLYPDNRSDTIDVIFSARSQLGVINW